MARIFLVIAILLTLVSAFLGFQTKGKVAEIRAELQATDQKGASSEADKKKALDAIKKAEAQLSEAKAAKLLADSAATDAKADAEKAKADLAALNSDVSAKETEIASLKEQLASQIRATPTGPDPETLAKLTEAETKLKEQAQVTETLQAKAKEAEGRAKTLEEAASLRERQISKPGLEGKVLAVNPNWNFVVLSIGDRAGVAPNSTLIVKRGEDLVAKVRVSSVEPSTSIADLIPGSTARGNYVRPGDTVIFNGM
jgi:peptidoglycan hydrolase CwlO-like protein